MNIILVSLTLESLIIAEQRRTTRYNYIVVVVNFMSKYTLFMRYVLKVATRYKFLE